MSVHRPRKIVIPGGSGQVGTLLARAFHRNGHEVVVLSRYPSAAPWRVVEWDGRQLGDWADEVDGSDVVINLAGRNVNCRYNGRNRREILESRVQSTRIVGQAIARARRPPGLWLQMGTATIYRSSHDQPNDETTGILGGSGPRWRFSEEVALAWEQALRECHLPQTRKVVLRSAMIMSPDRGGVFDMLLRLVQIGLGGRAGDGRQYVSWIHEADFIRAIEWLIDHPEMERPINLTSPNPLPNTQFMRTLREAAGIRFGLDATKWMLEIGAYFMRTETELVLKSRRVVPTRLLESGFSFERPAWAGAAEDLCTRFRRPSGVRKAAAPGDRFDPRGRRYWRIRR